MPLKESYVIWNNKGGVGKSTLTFHMATQYATENPTKSVLVIDLCPQANVSMALLSSQEQHGSSHLSSLRRQRLTVCFYLQRSLDPRQMVDAEDFLIKVRNYNGQLPENLSLLCGDMDLELVGRHLEYVRCRESVSSTTNPWLNVTSSIRNFIEGSTGKINGVTEDNADWVVFIDANPTFAVYTEIALAAARKLLIPINADDFSIKAVRAMFDSVYGIRQEDEETSEDFQEYRRYTFSHNAELYGLRRPKIHLFINNRMTMYNSQPVKTFRAMCEVNREIVFQVYQEHQRQIQCFAPQDGQQTGNIEIFKLQYFFDLQDFHSTAILCLHTGCPLGALGRTVRFRQADISVTVDRARLSEYLKCLKELVRKL